MTDNPYSGLLDFQVPDYPASDRWADILRWLVMVMDPDDRQLHFVASCLSYVLKNGGLSEKQQAVCGRIAERVYNLFGDGLLVCQNMPGPPQEPEYNDKQGMH